MTERRSSSQSPFMSIRQVGSLAKLTGIVIIRRPRGSIRIHGYSIIGRIVPVVRRAVNSPRFNESMSSDGRCRGDERDEYSRENAGFHCARVGASVLGVNECSGSRESCDKKWKIRKNSAYFRKTSEVVTKVVSECKTFNGNTPATSCLNYQIMYLATWHGSCHICSPVSSISGPL